MYAETKGVIRDYIEQMRHMPDQMELGENAASAQEAGECEWERVQRAASREKGKAKGTDKSKAPAEGNDKSADQQGGKGPQTGTRGHEDPDYFPHTGHDGGEKGGKAMHCTKARGQSRGNNGVNGVEDEIAEIAEPQDFGDYELCVVEGVWSGDFPPDFL